MTRNRRGVSLLEFMVVLFVIGVVAAIGTPRLTGARERASLNSAKDQVHAALATARAAAIRQGYPAQFHAQSGAVWVTAANGSATAAQVQVGMVASIEKTLSVSVSTTSNAALIQYDGRGFANLGGSGKIWLSRGVLIDSVCVTRLGAVMPGGCL
jgi:prepilin-type N-terminal cleavage/methylation domain-containing protein